MQMYSGAACRRSLPLTSQNVSGSGSTEKAADPDPAHETANRAPDLQLPVTTAAAQAATALAGARKPFAVLRPAILHSVAGGRIRARARNHAAAAAAADQTDSTKQVRI